MPRPYINPELFNSSSLSLLVSSPVSPSIYTTTSASTIPGIGYLCSKFIHGLGKAVLHAVDSVMVRRRLSYIESIYPLSGESPPPDDIEKIYVDLLEIVRPDLYSEHLRRRALHVLCEQIKRSETRHLVKSLKKWGSCERALILCEILHHFERTVNANEPEEFRILTFLYKEVLVYLSTQHPDRSRVLACLAVAISNRFSQTHQLSDLEEAILFHREVLELQPPPHPDRSQSLNNLAIDLSQRFDETGQLPDLEEAILLGREALELRPAPHPDRSQSFHNLAIDLSQRFNQTSHLADLEEAVLLSREALELRPSPHPRRPVSLHSLAHYLSKQFDQTNMLSDLDEAVLLSCEALELCLPPHPHRLKLLSNLADILSKRFERTRQPSDLEEANRLRHEISQL